MTRRLERADLFAVIVEIGAPLTVGIAIYAVLRP
jgi:hypothetical protein